MRSMGKNSMSVGNYSRRGSKIRKIKETSNGIIIVESFPNSNESKPCVVKCEHCQTIQLALHSSSDYFNCIECHRCYPITLNIIWNPNRTPAIGWNELTTLEALCDSTKALMGLKNYEKAMLNVHTMLKILRNRIEKSKRDIHELIPRCDFRETTKTRCNRTPCKLINGQYRCKSHENK
jgi:hypothetical protein